jgi:hypothetical protein
VVLGLLEALDHSIAFVVAVGIGNSELPRGIRGGALLIESGERSSDLASMVFAGVPVSSFLGPSQLLCTSAHWRKWWNHG